MMIGIKKLFDLLDKLLDYVYKKRCYFCHSSKECVKMCSKCYNELIFAPFAINRELNGIKVFSAGCYEKNLQKMIRGIKYHGQKELGFYMAKFLWKYFSGLNINRDYQVVPVPLHITRQKQRGYNHMEIVATEFCNLSGFSPNFDLIKRIKKTKPQYKLSRIEKIKNLEDAFSVDSSKDMNKPVLIIDDICTSGATFSSMINELRKNGINDIICLSVSSP